MIHSGIPAIALAFLAMPAAAEAASAFNFGFSVRSNYIDDGTTRSEDRPALQGYVEGSYGTFYAGVWSSTVDIDDDSLEVDLYAGIRPTFGNLSIDLSYYRYLYDDTGDCCGELVLLLLYPIAELSDVGLELNYDPAGEDRWAEVALAINLAQVYEVGGNIGSDFGSRDLGEGDKVAWNLGVSRTLGDNANVDLRYYESNYDPSRGVVALNLDF
jgi:uncharacterized protein (TIGR02001 family)